jgi:hypothetical protein
MERFWGRIERNRKNQRLHLWSQEDNNYKSLCGLEHNATMIVKSEEGLKCAHCWEDPRNRMDEQHE